MTEGGTGGQADGPRAQLQQGRPCTRDRIPTGTAANVCTLTPEESEVKRKDPKSHLNRQAQEHMDTPSAGLRQNVT